MPVPSPLARGSSGRLAAVATQLANPIDESNEPEFTKGSMIICDPKAPIIPGKYVVILVPDDQEALFGKFRPMGYKDMKRFKVLRTNPDYPQEIEFGGKVKGLIIARAIKHVRDI